MPPSRTAYFRRLITVAAAAVLVASALALSPPAAAQTQPFTDTSSDAYYSDAVAALADESIFDGTECAEGMLCPEASMDRKTMAVWTVRALDGQEPAPASGDGFTDVDAGSFHAPFIERMAELGVTSGCGDGSAFCPDDTVNRAQMAAFLTRGFNLDPGPDPGFSDVAPNAWYYNQAAALAASGITAGCGDGTTFCPNQPTTRAQMATFLARALGLVDKPTPAATGYQAVAIGSPPACGLRTDGTITCWWGGLYGSPTIFTPSQTTEIYAPQGTYKAVTAGGLDVCAIRTDNTLACWWFQHEELSYARTSEVSDLPAGTFKAISTGSEQTCAIRTDDTLTCWATSLMGDYPDYTPIAVLQDAPAGTYKTISAGNEWRGHTCAIGTDDTITCWSRFQVTVVPPPQGTYKAISVADGYTCAIGTDDTITCWGDASFFDEVGLADTPAGTFKAVSAGGRAACAIGTDGTITCWGSPPRDHFGTGEPIAAPRGSYASIEVGDSTCAIGTDGAITCWGGQLYECCGGAAPKGW